MLALVTQTISMEITAYSSTPAATLSQVEPEQLVKINFKSLHSEFLRLMPVLTKLVTDCCCLNIEKRDNVNKTFDCTLPAIVTVIGKILSTHNQRLSALKYMNSLLLKEGGAKDTCLQRFSELGDCVTPRSADRKLADMSEAALAKLKVWDGSGTDWCIVFDNVNPYIHVRQQTATHHNTLHSLTQAIAVRYKSPFLKDSTPEVALNSLELSHLLPTVEDKEQIYNYFAILVRNIVASFIPSLKWMATDLPKHSNTEIAKDKTEMINLGVQMLDENKTDEMVKLLQSYHKHVNKSADGSLDHKLCVGDYLSFKLGKSAQEGQADNVTAEARLEGLIMVMGDFHILMNQLDVTYDELFDATSLRAVGTLKHAINILQLKCLHKQPSKTYYASGELFDKVFQAYIITGFLEKLDMANVDSVCQIPEMERTETTANRLVSEFLNKFTDLTLPSDVADTVDKRCPVCHKLYSTVKRLLSHHQQKHPDSPPITCTGRDNVLVYTISLITLGLMRKSVKTAVRRSDGELLFRLYRYLFIMCKATGHTNYACGLLETVAQQRILPHHLSEALVHHRFANTRGDSESNIPLDLLMEHQNRTFKSQLHIYRGEYTQNHLDKISLGSNLRDQAVLNYDRQYQYFISKGEGSPELSQGDVRLLVDMYKDANLFTDKTTRAHCSALAFISPNPMRTMSSEELHRWMKQRLSLLATKNVYKQFHK